MYDRIKVIAARYQESKDQIQTEEATKNALIMPLLAALGYDVFNPLEVIPEFTADIGVKKGEKIDYAVKQDGQITMLIECKWCGAELDDKYISQLFRYFTAADAHLGVLTNGVEYHFFADVDKANKMDETPFFTFNILNFEEHHLNELKRFAKNNFDINVILSTANDMKYMAAIKQKLNSYLHEPSETLTKCLLTDMSYSGRLTQQVVDSFAAITKDALNQFIREKVNDRLKSALLDNQNINSVDLVSVNQTTIAAQPENKEIQTGDDGIVTTQDEIDGYNIVKAILCEIIPVKRVVMRDAKSYCAILLDDNNRKPICRLYFNNPSRLRLALFSNKIEEIVQIEELDHIYQYADKLKATVQEYDTGQGQANNNGPDKQDSGTGDTERLADE